MYQIRLCTHDEDQFDIPDLSDGTCLECNGTGTNDWRGVYRVPCPVCKAHGRRAGDNATTCATTYATTYATTCPEPGHDDH